MGAGREGVEQDSVRVEVMGTGSLGPGVSGSSVPAYLKGRIVF